MNAAAMTLAHRAARQAVERSIRDSGQKLQAYTVAERQRLAREWLQAHPELIEETARRYADIIAPSRR